MFHAGIHQHSPPDEKIALFRSLFRGRDDVYPRRYVSRKTGRSGYSPACNNEWVAGVCEKPRIACAKCLNQGFLPLTDDVIRWHLCGCDDQGNQFATGVYPLCRDDRCFLLVIDFDKPTWQEDVLAVEAASSKLGICSALERSRSGRGAHLWFFFATAVPAVLARRLGAYLLTEAMNQRPELGLDSYDRLIPSQDLLPNNGFGGQVALPLEQRPRRQGNGVFVDRNFRPYDDQWAFLSGLNPLSTSRLERVVARAGSVGRIVGVRSPSEDDDQVRRPRSVLKNKRRSPDSQLSPRLQLTLADQVYFDKRDLSPQLQNQLLRIAAFQNSAFSEAQAMRRSTYGHPRIVACAEDYACHLGIPRGCIDEIVSLLGDYHIEPDVADLRQEGETLEVSFRGVLRPEQLAAAEAMLAHDTGVLVAPTAFGKTVLASWLIAKRAVNTLVLVHRRQLQDQWRERLSELLGLPAAEIGSIGGGRSRATGNIDVATVQSLARDGEVKPCVGDYGQVIVDECHHVAAPSYELVVRRAMARYVAGLTATLIRRDGRHLITLMQCGPVRRRVDPLEAARKRPFRHVVHVRPTSFRASGDVQADPRQEFISLAEELADNEERNQMICHDVAQALDNRRRPLVLTERRGHLATLANLLEPLVDELVVLHGGRRAPNRVAETHPTSATPPERLVVIATGPFIGEGYDNPNLDTLFLTMPVSWRGTVAQYAGRLHRLHDGKQEVQIYDYADLNVPMLARMFDRRARGYTAVGYEIMLPGHAVAGWPAEMPLPIDPLWKREHAATVRRLATDGVDVTLAELFAEATRVKPEDRVWPEGARSATEAFFFRRLETLPETAGKFGLNRRLPIAFDRDGMMEVDFLCHDPPIAIELDGDQHLGDREAYRRDRRKDALLQAQGYLVLRFLAVDVHQDLDAVLDTVLRTLANRRVERATRGPPGAGRLTDEK